MEKIKEKNILSKITEIYIIVMVMIFPLCVDSTGFFRILEAKYSYFLIINAIYISAIIITIFYYLLFKKTNIFKEIKFHKIQWAVVGFLIINIISTFELTASISSSSLLTAAIILTFSILSSIKTYFL